jgi:EmrB/QacA subfamily drug resistance transporter
MTTVTLPTPAPPTARARALHWAPLAVVLTGTFMVVLDFFIVNVALPSIGRSLHASSGSLEWISAGYALSTAVLLVTGGRLGDRFGRRRVFAAGLALFTLSSGLCGAAQDPTVLVAGRLLQGCGGALLTTNVLSILGILYSGEDRTRAMAAYGMVMGVAAVGGQLLGGGLVALDPLGLDWRSCFLINLPIGLLGLAAAERFVPESRGDRTARLDVGGLLLLGAGITAVVLPLVEGRQYGWPVWTWLSLGAAPLILGAFALRQRRAHAAGAAPLLEPVLFTQRAFVVGMLAQLTFWCGQASFFLVLALYLQGGRRLSPLGAGLVFTALAATYLLTSMRAPSLAARHGRRIITAAALVIGAGHAVLLGTAADIGTGGSVLALLPGLLLVGAGMGLAIAPLTTNLLAGMRPELAGAAAGALATAQSVGTAFGVAIVGVAFFGSLGGGYASAFEHGLGVLVVIAALVAGLSFLLPRPPIAEVDQ